MVTTTTKSSNGKVDDHILTAEAILAAKDLKEETVEIPEWGGSIKIRSFSKKGQQEIRDLATIEDEVDADRLEMYMFLRGVIEPHFTDDQYELLREKSAGVIDRILERLTKLSGMDEESRKVAEKRFRK